MLGSGHCPAPYPVQGLPLRDREKLWKDLGWTHLNIVSLSADKSHEVSSAFFDVAYRSGQTWIATNRGLIRLDFLTTERQIFRKEQGLIDDEVTTVATTGGEVWH
jgi:ligand-binding sensor domain-containing protein